MGRVYDILGINKILHECFIQVMPSLNDFLETEGKSYNELNIEGNCMLHLI